MCSKDWYFDSIVLISKIPEKRSDCGISNVHAILEPTSVIDIPNGGVNLIEYLLI